uniref:Uncharacterized protein n=1 Tax=Rhizophora mucronata TaxID=61149 RepID=A0A2P2N0S5_RHIMU
MNGITRVANNRGNSKKTTKPFIIARQSKFAYIAKESEQRMETG